jgi:hypothetical protein
MKTLEYLSQDTMDGVAAMNETWHLQNSDHKCCH